MLPIIQRKDEDQLDLAGVESKKVDFDGDMQELFPR